MKKIITASFIFFIILSFTKAQDTTIVFYEQFNDMSCWTPIGPFGMEAWAISYSHVAGGAIPEMNFYGQAHPAPVILSQLISCEIDYNAYHYKIKLLHACTLFESSEDINLGIAVTYDGGITKQIIWQCQAVSPTGVIGPEKIETEFYPTSDKFQFILFYSGEPAYFYINRWYIDNILVIDDCLQCFPPEAPTNLIAYNQYYLPARIRLHWSDNSWNEDGFLLLRKNNSSIESQEYKIIDTCSANSTTYVDYSVSIDSNYSYSVIAFNKYGVSDTSNTANVTVTPIPVELISFSASQINESVNLSWSTASELNNYGFEIERSADKMNWRLVGFKEGKGTTTETHNYSFTDDLFGNNSLKLFYRLKQIDFNGSFEYSDVVEIDIAPSSFSLSQNYPNPFNPLTSIEYRVGSREIVTLKVYDVLGREAATLANEEKQPGVYEVEFQSSVGGKPLASGIYYYLLKAGNFVETKKMILIK